jgi:hypothetical protein
MLVGNISSIAPTASGFNPVLVAQPASAPSSTPATTPVSAQPTSANGVAPPPAPARAETPRAHGAQAASVGANAAASALLDTLITGYTTTVAGTQYSGSVEQSGQQYTASVPNLIGATATGTSVLDAEENLNVRIDELA